MKENLVLEQIQRHVLNGKLLYGDFEKLRTIEPGYLNGQHVITATPYHQIAIFEALLGACKNGEHRYKTHPGDKNKVQFEMCSDKLNSLLTTNCIGYIYVLDSSSFKKMGNYLYSCEESMYPVDIITVTKGCLPFYPVVELQHYSFTPKKEIALLFN